jgi:hypothetical protein
MLLIAKEKPPTRSARTGSAAGLSACSAARVTEVSVELSLGSPVLPLTDLSPVFVKLLLQREILVVVKNSSLVQSPEVLDGQLV